MKVNTKTLTATRESLPMALIGLSAQTLKNLQTALNPVPSEFQDIEFWDEVDNSQDISDTTVYDGTETLTCNADTKTVTVVKGIRAKTQEELEAERKAKVPQILTPRQARLALLAVDLLDDAELLVTNDRALQVWWEYSLDIQRDHPMVTTLAVQLDLDEEQLDNLFIEGAKL